MQESCFVGFFSYWFANRVIVLCCTGNMRDELKKIDCLKKLVRDEHPKTWDRIVFPNVKCLLRQILSGLSYLHQMNVQHCDLKRTYMPPFLTLQSKVNDYLNL